jgi:serine protease Do
VEDTNRHGVTLLGLHALGVACLLVGACAAPAHGTRPADPSAAGASGAPPCEESRTQLYKRASPAVVYIHTQRINPYAFQDRVERSVGSGFIFDHKGLILTNFHVVGSAQAIQVTLDDGHIHRARMVGGDPIFDLAVISISPRADGTLPVLPLGDSSGLRVGDDVVAIGNPLGLEQTLTHGVVSALNRLLPESSLLLTPPMIQTDAPINPGSSGGPLLDACGRVIGINSEIIENAQNIGFAIPIDLVKQALPSLLRTGHVARPWVGFHGQLVDLDLGNLLRIPLVPGLLVEVVEPGSPAEAAGIRGGELDVSIAGDAYLLGGDIVTQINGVKVDSVDALARAMETLEVGKTITLSLFRDGRKRTVEYRMPERPLLPGDIRGDTSSLRLRLAR